MTLRDLVEISTGNLWRMKLRAILTISGVLIAIAAFVSMVSFGAGNQEFIEAEFNKLGLFSTMQVYPKRGDSSPDSAPPVKLDRAALDRIAAVPGVNLVYPYDALSVKVVLGDTVMNSRAQALPAAAIRTKLFSHFAAGAGFSGDSARSAVVSDDFLKDAGITNFDSVLGKSIILSVRVSVIDSGLAHILVDRDETLLDRIKRIEFDSLRRSSYRGRIIREEVNEVVRRFVSGFTGAQATVGDTLTITGVRETSHMGGSRIEPIIIPVGTVRRFTSAGMSGNPAEIFSAMSTGTLFDMEGGKDTKSFNRVTLDFDPKIPYTVIRDSVEGLGFRTFSFAAEFEQIQQVFLYLNLALGLIGLIALSTASLGIANIMIMSINERRREIGILKSLGADEGDVRMLFLVESGVIGLAGTVFGIFFGWGITRIASLIAQTYMERQGIPPIDLFTLPLWLVAVSITFGVGVSIVAGLYPASRAARVDPVAALRNE